MQGRRNLPLDGLTVVDLGQVYQGPYATYLMAKAGANVIKIEPLAGEPVRQRDSVSRGSGAPFAMLNGHKKCITLDLKSGKGKEILKRLVKDADVLLENYAPGVMDRLGVCWDGLGQLNPPVDRCAGFCYGGPGPGNDHAARGPTVPGGGRLRR